MSTQKGVGGSGSAGRFGARYGRIARRRVSEIESEMHDDHGCPSCGADAVSRSGTGIWECDRCGHTFTGGAYRPETPGGRAVTRSIRTALSEEEAEAENDEA
ncbi:MAG: 50S ribosomal protein L37ae [Halanaeroarchaeum sp.]